MPEDTDDLDQESGEQEAPPDPAAFAKMQKSLKEANEEAKKARLELQRVKLEKVYGDKVMALVPASLPQEEWEAQAERVKVMLAGNTPEQTAPEAPPPVQETEPVGFGTVANAPPPGTQASEPLLTAHQLHDLFKTDPSRATQMLNAGQFQKEGRPDGTKGWVVDPSV